MALEPGARLGAYEIRSQLGAGGMGEVYRAHDSRLARDVAIKVLHPSAEGGRSRLWREAHATADGAPAARLRASRYANGKTHYRGR